MGKKCSMRARGVRAEADLCILLSDGDEARATRVVRAGHEKADGPHAEVGRHAEGLAKRHQFDADGKDVRP